MELKKVMIKTEKGFSTNILVLNRFKTADMAVIVNELIPSKVCEMISIMIPQKNPSDSAFTKVDVKLLKTMKVSTKSGLTFPIFNVSTKLDV